MEEKFRCYMKELLDELSVTLSDRQMGQFYRYYEMLVEWNKVMNLTAITELEEVVRKHFVDSLALTKLIPGKELETMNVLDLGTGAGFPGIPLKIAFPEMRITLLDSLNKRIRFLDEVIQTLELKNIQTIHGRAEDYGRDGTYREQFDLCVSRAVANLSTLSEYCTPFVRKDGLFVPYKSGQAEAEIQEAKGALKVLNCKIENTVEFQLPGSDDGRTLVKIRKVKTTDKRYPRKAGLPGKEPLR